MKRKRVSPFHHFIKMFQTGLMASELASSSLEVISHRSKLIAQAMNGTVPVTHAEFYKMWQEKLTANMQAAAILSKTVSKRKRSAPVKMPNMLMSSVQLCSSLLIPYHRKANANARRLRRTLK